MNSFEKISALVNSAIQQTKWQKEPGGLYDPIAYTMGQGGKRIRPALTLMACNLFSENIELALKPAIGIEVFHNFTLLHDDIMDKATIRRGKPTVHVKWDENTAILSGDVMQIIAYEQLLETPSQHLKKVLDLFTKTAAEICEGQQYDMEFEQRDDVLPEEYLEMIRLKTAVLLGCSLKTGAIIGGASEEDAQHLYDFGINIGLAFQLKDDLLDVYGNTEIFGKQVGGDILCNKKTYLLIHAQKAAQEDIKTKLHYWLNEPTPDPGKKIREVTGIYNRLGVRKICEDAMSSYYEKAIAFLEKVSVPTNKKQELRKLAEKLMFRND
ncbi:MAG: polyprenyl synthetase family protein [Paludibacter sp.]|nr:polyprenyl synthetase family protein [Paludibacter sp.]MDD4197965.1 polyprenyl synthetase family protein [Paludibacter sp.]MDD4427220.1 polyprenyl synthetase family protein [Paludibacter sp.]